MELQWKDVRPSDLPEDLREIRDALGDDVVRYLIEYWGGTSIYVPSLKKLRTAIRHRAILDAYDGNNESQIIRMFGVSRRSLRRLLKDDSKLL